MQDLRKVHVVYPISTDVIIKPALRLHVARITQTVSSFRASDNPLATVPPEIVVTSARPDMVVVRNC